MKITICGSVAFLPEMVEARTRLTAYGHEVRLPLEELVDGEGNIISAAEYYAIRHADSAQEEWVWERKSEAIREHFGKIVWSDAVLIVNPEKKGIAGYIGGNTLMEMGLAFHLAKPIYLTHEIPELSYTEEIRGMHPLVLSSLESLK